VRKLLSLLVLMVFLVVSPVFAVVPGPDSSINSSGQEGKGAKRLTPLLDLLGDELEKVGIRLFDNAVYSLDRLWQDTINLNIRDRS